MWYLALMALIAGSIAPVQVGLNSQLGRHIEHPLLAALVSFLVGTASLIAVMAFTGPGLAAMPKLLGAPWFLWLGGLCGAIFVTITIISSPKLGAASTMGLVIAGQMLASVILDHYGLVWFEAHPVSLIRIFGLILMIVGVVLIQKF